MKISLIILFFNLFIYTNIHAQRDKKEELNLADFSPKADGITDDTPAFLEIFKQVKNSNGGVIVIPAGDYYVSGKFEIPMHSNTTVFSHGANFYLPKHLGDEKRIVLFSGEDISNFSWYGGSFNGFVYNPEATNNTWEPNVSTRIFVINTSEKGKTDNIIFSDVHSQGIAGSVINVNGYSSKSKSRTNNFATNVTVENCSLINSGKFMWDYGFLWQIVVFSEYYSRNEIDMAYKYFDTDLIIKNISMQNGESHILLNNSNSILEKNQNICFFNDKLPDNIIKGKKYYVVNSSPTYIEISGARDGNPIIFKGNGGKDVQIIKNATNAFYIWAPKGSGPGKGAVDLVSCENTLIKGCKLSAYGDAMHVYACHNNIISNNHILGARMGAFFLAEYCENSTISGNIVEGNNGSRILSVERSNKNVTLTGNIFKGGGRGAWINQPENIIIKDNIFVNNTNKGVQNPVIGRRNIVNGGWQSYSEIYFTTYETNATYGPVILKDNIFITNDAAAAAIQFEKNGNDILVEGNVFKGATKEIWLDEQDESIIIRNNNGDVVKKGKEYSKPLFRNMR
ncbi:right-handed parallel beta-helix repeat-containing protein [Maribellus maritimus]|uniref:right-handed parallel beta-helix repeat-containing protein n=1 Tax=Maribellus maritimus TaxID=2870838 RepID=UPI001EECB09E|nr:right-handed parallel beta-helix repeat-containing protein [Maribellus maritimus]MCG6189697.1 right-handed parallel beta-helix repeat-containing protein [Maribellus maritimus]